MMMLDKAGHQFPARFQALQRARLVDAHEARIADNVGAKYGRKFPFNCHEDA
jgi:hypothetical protein